VTGTPARGPVACVFCGFGTLAAVHEPVEVGSQPVICGGCGAVQVLTVTEIGDVPTATLRKAGSLELRELLEDPDVRRYRDAFDIETIERASEGVRKSKVKGRVRLRPGEPGTQLPPMTARGPG
jgi:hypothetical protein